MELPRKKTFQREEVIYFLSSKEETIRSKDETISKIISSKDETISKMNEIIRSKDETIESIRREMVAEKREALRARGLLSSRGIFERVLQLLHAEENFRGKFNATQAIQQLQQLSPSNQSGRWANCLFQSVSKSYGSSVNIVHQLTTLYSTLSVDVHGQPWNQNSVQISDQLGANDKQFIEELCRCMGLL